MAASPHYVDTKAPSAKRIRVLHIIQNLNYGGMERLLRDIVTGVDQSRFEGEVLVLQYLGRFAEGLDKVARLHLAEPMSAWSMLRPMSLARQIARIDPHVVHTHSGVWYKATRAARMAGVPRVIHTEHGRRMPDPMSDRIVDTLAARRTDVVVAVSERLRDDLIARHIVPARRVQVVRNGVDTSATPAHALGLSLRAELKLPAEVPVIGSIGRLESIKGFDVMIDAFGRLLANWSEEVKPALVVAGEGSERQRLEGMIKERNLESNVFLLGWRNDALALHALFSVFTLSSRSEGTSVSLLEAMSSGLCPVVTDVGGNRAVLGAELGHRLVPSEDAAGLASAWRDALQNHDRRRSDGRIARTRVSREFSLGSMIAAYERLYSVATHNGLGPS